MNKKNDYRARLNKLNYNVKKIYNHIKKNNNNEIDMKKTLDALNNEYYELLLDYTELKKYKQKYDDDDDKLINFENKIKEIEEQIDKLKKIILNIRNVVTKKLDEIDNSHKKTIQDLKDELDNKNNIINKFKELIYDEKTENEADCYKHKKKK